MIIIGIGLGLILLLVETEGAWVSLIYGVPILIIGIVILFNKGEDKIERRKDK